jgi:Fe2+ or Zn2+ uptake regulation protein
MTRPARLTKRQKKIMGVILKAAGEGRLMTIKEIHKEAAEPGLTYGATRKSISILEEAQMIIRESIAKSHFKNVRPTTLGFDWFRPART